MSRLGFATLTKADAALSGVCVETGVVDGGVAPPAHSVAQRFLIAILTLFSGLLFVEKQLIGLINRIFKNVL